MIGLTVMLGLFMSISRNESLLDRELLLPGEAVTQGFALDIGHHIEELAVGRTRIVKRQDVGVGQPRGNLDLAEKPVMADGRSHLGEHDLDRDLATVLHILRQIDGCHASVAKFTVDPITIR